MFSSLRGQSYSGSLQPSKNTFQIPPENIMEDVLKTIELVRQSGDYQETQVEYRAHSLVSDQHARIWDEGTPLESGVDDEGNIYRKWSVDAFVINDEVRIGGQRASVEFVWHVQPRTSDPSNADKDAAFHHINIGGMTNSTWFVVGASDAKVSFIGCNGSVHKIDMQDSFKMSRRSE